MSEAVQSQREGTFAFEVNGIKIETGSKELRASEILKLAAEHHAMPGKPEEYVLQGDKGQYAPDDLVDLFEDNVFITIPTAPTPVA